jgi:PhnB protein
MVDPLNAKFRHPLTVMLTVSDVKAAASFYEKVFGFEQLGFVMGPDGQIVHAELAIRGQTQTSLMLTPAERGARTAREVAHSPAILFLMVDDVDKVVAEAKRSGGLSQADVLTRRDRTARVAVVGEIEDMFWGDRRAHVFDPDGHDWLVATHVADFSQKQLEGRNVTFSGGRIAEAFKREDAPHKPPAFPG